MRANMSRMEDSPHPSGGEERGSCTRESRHPMRLVWRLGPGGRTFYCQPRLLRVPADALDGISSAQRAKHACTQHQQELGLHPEPSTTGDRYRCPDQYPSAACRHKASASDFPEAHPTPASGDSWSPYIAMPANVSHWSIFCPIKFINRHTNAISKAVDESPPLGFAGWQRQLPEMPCDWVWRLHQFLRGGEHWTD